MGRPTIIRAVVAVIVIGCLVAGFHRLWATPLSPIPSKASIGKLNLEREGASLQVRFVPPKRLMSVTSLIYGEVVTFSHGKGACGVWGDGLRF